MIKTKGIAIIYTPYVFATFLNIFITMNNEIERSLHALTFDTSRLYNSFSLQIEHFYSVQIRI